MCRCWTATLAPLRTHSTWRLRHTSRREVQPADFVRFIALALAASSVLVLVAVRRMRPVIAQAPRARTRKRKSSPRWPGRRAGFLVRRWTRARFFGGNGTGHQAIAMANRSFAFVSGGFAQDVANVPSRSALNCYMVAAIAWPVVVWHFSPALPVRGLTMLSFLRSQLTCSGARYTRTANLWSLRVGSFPDRVSWRSPLSGSYGGPYDCSIDGQRIRWYADNAPFSTRRSIRKHHARCAGTGSASISPLERVHSGSSRSNGPDEALTPLVLGQSNVHGRCPSSPSRAAMTSPESPNNRPIPRQACS